MTLHARLAELATHGATPQGIDRGLFTASEHAARALFARWASDAGLRVEQDRAGNVFARVVGLRDDAPVQCGSHLDTVKNGGAYDGAYGVVGGLEAVTRVAASEPHPPHSIEVVAWAGEEGSRFPLGCLGSSVYAGLNAYPDVAALIGDDGESFDAALRGPHGLLADVPVRDDFPPPAAYVELHIEQGPILESTGARLGIVTAIAGQRRLSVVVQGVAGHAGTMPMRGRADALVAASELVLAVERVALETGDAVATVGRMLVAPNQTNIVPGEVLFRVDIRSVDDARVLAIEGALRGRAAEIAAARGVRVAIETLEVRDAVPMETRMRALVRRACLALDPSAIDIASGAGHDAMCIAQIVPTAMIFVPSAGGRSHVGDEHTAPDDLELGVDALAAVLSATAAHTW